MAEIYLKIKRWQIGQPLAEDDIKAGLVELNPNIVFDLGSKLNLPHPEIDYCQGVFLMTRQEGRRHLCSLDRGVLDGGVVSEVPIWSTAKEVVEVPHVEISVEEIRRQPEMYPMPCFHDPEKWQIIREVRQELLLCGWRYTFDKLVNAHIPGIDRRTLANRFKVDVTRPLTDFEAEVACIESNNEPWVDESVEEGKILEEMGEYEARPTVVLTGSDWEK